jgi:S-DNA-T family DNA segregation ATPase FtsK/SpoIIIE
MALDPTTPPAPPPAAQPGRGRRPTRTSRARQALAAARVRLLGPPAPPAPDENLLQLARRVRATRPLWLRVGFVGLLAILLAGLFGPGRTVLAAIGLAATAAAWPELEWPGRIAAPAAAISVAVAVVGWQATIPLVLLTVFARWFCTDAETDQDQDQDRAAGPAARTGPALTADTFMLPPPSLPAGAHDSAEPPTGDPVGAADTQPAAGLVGMPEPDPATLGHVVERWAQITEHAGLKGSLLQHPTATSWGWEAGLLLLPGQTIDTARGCKDALESALEVRRRAVRLDEDPRLARRVLLRVLERDPLAQTLLWPGPRAGSILNPISLGPFEDGTLMRLPLYGQCVLIAGLRGSGKSGVLHVCIGELAACPDAVLWGIDLKHGLELKAWEPVFAHGRIAHTLDQAEQLLGAAERVMHAHGDLLAHHGAKEWRPSPTRPALVVVIDEQGRLRDSASAIATLERIATLGRTLGVGIISATQYPTVEVLGSGELRSQYTVQILLRVQRKQHVTVVLGEDAAREGWRADLIPADQPGVLYPRGPGMHIPKLGRGWRVTDPMVPQVAARYAPHRPSLHPDAAAATATDSTGQPTGSAGTGPTSAPPTVAGTWWTAPGTTPDPATGPAAGANADAATGPLPAVPPDNDPERALAAMLTALELAGPTGIHADELIGLTGMSRSWVYKKLRELATAGGARQVSPGRWRAATPPTTTTDNPTAPDDPDSQ